MHVPIASSRFGLVRQVLASSLMFATGLLLIAIGCSSGSSSSSSTTTTTTTTGSGGSSTWTGGGDGIWRRDANSIYGEAATFDPCKAHQPGSGEYHYHENPVCLRYQLGDNITATNVGTASATYTESTATLHHSPILGWAFDGYPIYGPYAYSNTNGTGAIRRMASSYALRTDNIATRTSLPAWAQAYQGLTTLTSSQYGPAVSSTYPLGRYIEDYAYTQGFGDLDQYNGRFCITPDFPAGTYAYFVTIDASGNAAFPYYLGPQFYGTASGGNVTSISETTTTYYNNHALQSGSSSNPTINSWLETYTNQLAQILYVNSSDAVVGPVTTWTGNTTAVDADIQEVRYSTGFVYLNISGLASHMMGPWYMTSARTSAFVNLPTNQNTVSRVPLNPAVASTKTATGGGSQGRWLNGVGMFNMLDFASWSNAQQQDVMP